MRRRVWWIGGVLALLAVAFVAALFLAPAGPPYPFLRGHEPVNVKLTRAEKDHMKQHGYTKRVYSFPADYDKLVPVVDSELRARKLQYAGTIMGDKDNVRLYVQFMEPSSRGRSMLIVSATNQVLMMRDTQARNGSMIEKFPGKAGWVTFVVDTKDAPSVFDNFRAWLGL